jgi:hypothetical protein
MTAALAKPPSKEDDSEDDEGDSKEAETPESEDEKPSETGGGASAGTAGGDMNGACFGDASEAPADPLEVTEKEGGRFHETDSVHAKRASWSATTLSGRVMTLRQDIEASQPMGRKCGNQRTCCSTAWRNISTALYEASDELLRMSSIDDECARV